MLGLTHSTLPPLLFVVDTEQLTVFGITNGSCWLIDPMQPLELADFVCVRYRSLYLIGFWCCGVIVTPTQNLYPGSYQVLGKINSLHSLLSR